MLTLKELIDKVNMNRIFTPVVIIVTRVRWRAKQKHFE